MSCPVAWGKSGKFGEGLFGLAALPGAVGVVESLADMVAVP